MEGLHGIGGRGQVQREYPGKATPKYCSWVGFVIQSLTKTFGASEPLNGDAGSQDRFLSRIRSDGPMRQLSMLCRWNRMEAPLRFSDGPDTALRAAMADASVRGFGASAEPRRTPMIEKGALP